MSGCRWLMFAALAATGAAAGCDGASSARETSGSAAATATAPPAAAANGAVEPTAAAPTPGADAGGLVEASFDDLKFPMEKSDAFQPSMLTDRVKGLFGRRIRIRGYIYPTPRRRGLTQFVLVRDNLECCFGPGAALFDCILVSMTGGATAEYTIRPIAVEGEFQFKELPGPDGRPLAIFQMAGEAVK